jgi:hypothetical protein
VAVLPAQHVQAAAETFGHVTVRRYARTASGTQTAVIAPAHSRDWPTWAAQLVPTVAVAAVTAWLDAGQPDPDRAVERVSEALFGVIAAAKRR